MKSRYYKFGVCGVKESKPDSLCCNNVELTKRLNVMDKRRIPAGLLNTKQRIKAGYKLNENGDWV